MVERRKPLVLSSTKHLLNSLLDSAVIGKRDDAIDRINLHPDEVTSPPPPTLQLRAGILRLSKDQSNISRASLDDAVLVGLSTSVLKNLSITSGSLVVIKNLDMDIQRIAKLLF